MKRYLLTALLLSFFNMTQAQLQVTGKVQTEFLEPLTNATISMEPAERSTQANENGEFQLSVPEKGSYMLRIHYLGNQVYAKTVRVQNQNQYVGLITVKSAAVEMDEVSVTGYKSPMVLEKPTYNVAKIPLRNLENAQVYSVIDGNLLDQQLIFNVDEGSRNITGLQNIWNATSRSGDGGAYVSLRGFVSTNTLRNGLAGGISGTVDAANLERLEVLKGPSGTLFGNVLAGYGGMINRITKKAEDHNFGSASLAGGSNNMLRAQVDVNRVLNDEKTALFRLNAAYNTESSFQNSNLKTSYFFVSPTFTYSPNTRTHITLEAEYTQGKSSNMGQMLGFSYPDTQYGVRSIKDFSIDYNLSLQGDGLDQDYRNLNLFGILDYEISPFIKSSTNISFSQNYSDGFGAYYYFVPNSVATGVESAAGTDYVQRADQSTRDSKKNYFQIQQNFNADFKIGSMRNRMVLGLDYLRVRDKQYFYGSSFDMINVTDAVVDITAFNGTNMWTKYAAGDVDFTYPLDGTMETY
ncbi:MAG: carboxypeptidase-like regulatory domain-containing protein, partial [Sphingobacterium sp.]